MRVFPAPRASPAFFVLNKTDKPHQGFHGAFEYAYARILSVSGSRVSQKKVYWAERREGWEIHFHWNAKS